MSKSWKIDRRHFLKGCGVALALPYLDIMGAESSTAQAPVRFLSMFIPNGVFPKAWDVDKLGNDYTFSRILKPLETYREDFTLLSGVDNVPAGDHVAMTSCFLTGVSIKDTKEFKSLDQVIADKVGKNTLLPSLELGTEPPRQGKTGVGPISWANTTSWRSKSQRLSPEINPRVAFDRMFRFQSNPAQARKEAEARRSVLDLAMDDLKSLQKKASKKDKDKLDEYYSSIRAVEKGIEKNLNPPKRDWISPMKPDYKRPPAGIPRNRDEHLKMMIDLMVLAFWTDTTRVGTLMTAHGFSRQNFSFLEGVKNDHHGMSHHKNNPTHVEEYTRVSQWYVGQLAYLMDRMKKIDDGNGSMLDNSSIFFGSGMKDGNGHIKDNLPLVLAGRAGGKLKPGSHVKAPKGTKLTNLHVTLQQLYGIESNAVNGVEAATISELV